MVRVRDRAPPHLLLRAARRHDIRVLLAGSQPEGLVGVSGQWEGQGQGSGVRARARTRARTRARARARAGTRARARARVVEGLAQLPFIKEARVVRGETEDGELGPKECEARTPRLYAC